MLARPLLHRLTVRFSSTGEPGTYPPQLRSRLSTFLILQRFAFRGRSKTRCLPLRRGHDSVAPADLCAQQIRSAAAVTGSGNSRRPCLLRELGRGFWSRQFCAWAQEGT